MHLQVFLPTSMTHMHQWTEGFMIHNHCAKCSRYVHISTHCLFRKLRKSHGFRSHANDTSCHCCHAYIIIFFFLKKRPHFPSGNSLVTVQQRVRQLRYEAKIIKTETKWQSSKKKQWVYSSSWYYECFSTPHYTLCIYSFS